MPSTHGTSPGLGVADTRLAPYASAMHDPWSNLVDCLSGSTQEPAPSAIARASAVASPAASARTNTGRVHRLLDEQAATPRRPVQTQTPRQNRPRPEPAAAPKAFVGTALDLRMLVEFGVMPSGSAADRFGPA